MLDWLGHNKEWVFSGIGVLVISSLIGFLRWFFKNRATPRHPLKQKNINEQNSSVNQSPIINNLVNVSSPAIALEPSLGTKHKKDNCPEIFALPPWAGELSLNSFEGKLPESLGDPINVCLARFKLAADDNEGIGHQLTATIEF